MTKPGGSRRSVVPDSLLGVGGYHHAAGPRRSIPLLDALAAVSPGQPLREGLDRILQAGMGALIVVGDGPEVLNICSGGFLLDAAFSPQRLSELAKMDGAIILAGDASRIARANVHLVPNPNVPTSETGTRHRTAERVARSIDVPVISVSEDMQVIAVYVDDAKYPLEPIPRLLNKANQALSTLERYKSRLDGVSGALSALEVEDLVTVRDVVTVLQRTEMVRRIAEEIEGHIVELGVDGRLVRLQLEELMGGVEDDRRLVIQDYFHEEETWRVGDALEALAELDTDDLLDLKIVASMLHLTGGVDLDLSLQPRGHRLLSKIPRLPDVVIDKIVERFENLQKIMRATIDDLDDVEGVGEARARAIKEGLARLAETSILDRYN
ncbi:MAG TPA: DNA integrity scanning diadenylate cyclase DisA [Acidimicrobiales bacterium]|jgi:diadenylate cyclase|nr:DNA integrity scanning diadenylate cyclase DisA [Acidimicrobiales bacterium]